MLRTTSRRSAPSKFSTTGPAAGGGSGGDAGNAPPVSWPRTTMPVPLNTRDFSASAAARAAARAASPESVGFVVSATGAGG